MPVDPELDQEQRGFPPSDESVNVDVNLIEHYLRLTPSERLQRLEDFVNAAQSARGGNGDDSWSVSANCSKD